jgi:hypothetical protein
MEAEQDTPSQRCCDFFNFRGNQVTPSNDQPPAPERSARQNDRSVQPIFFPRESTSGHDFFSMMSINPQPQSSHNQISPDIEEEEGLLQTKKVQVQPLAKAKRVFPVLEASFAPPNPEIKAVKKDMQDLFDETDYIDSTIIKNNYLLNNAENENPSPLNLQFIQSIETSNRRLRRDKRRIHKRVKELNKHLTRLEQADMDELHRLG